MRNLLNLILRAPDGEGGGGGAPAGGAPAAGSPEGGAPAVPPAGGEGGTPAAPQTYRPEGLSDQYFGETDHQTIDKLTAAIAARGEVPADVAAYREIGDVPDELKPYYATIEQDGLFDAVASKAKDLGVTTAQLHGILGAYMSGAAEMGLLEPPIDVAAERSALLPDDAKSLPKAEQDRRIDQRMNDNLGWLDLMVQRGLPTDSAKHMSLMLGDTADGHKAIEWFRSQLTGADEPRPAGAGSSAAGSSTKDDLARRAALPENTPGNPKFSKSSYDKLSADYQAAYPG